ncbi:MAG: M10 family metallopeptidase C-terminal domain-containing protein, partial [Paracoccaceae bacterium]|nr:M10 family metallopeptidase C-terminal domain-containing protein [Paracoccaceae bacterium]
DGGAGDDLIFGIAGVNQLYGGAGDDRFQAGTGRDVMTGGAGADVFIFGSVAAAGLGGTRDAITDFTSGVDHIDLSALHITRFIGAAVFSGVAGELRYVPGLTTGLVVGDVDGDGMPDFILELIGSPGVVQSDFIF